MDRIVVIVVIIAILGNLYLFSGGDVDGEIAGLLVGVAVIVDLIIIGFLIYQIANYFIKIIENHSGKELSKKKEKIVNEIGERIIYKQGILDNIDSFFRKKGQVVSFIQLICSCSDNNLSSFDSYIKNENKSFVHARKDMIKSIDRLDSKRFPKNLSQINNYINLVQEKIDVLKSAHSSIASADKMETNKIILDFCPNLSKTIKKRKAKIASIISCIFIVVITFAILLSTNFIMFLAENYHKSVLMEHLQVAENYKLTIENIDYEETYSYLNDDNEFTFDTTAIYFKSELPVSIYTEYQNSKEIANKLYRLLNTKIEYTWAMKKVHFENSDDLKVVISDESGSQIE